MSAQPAIFLDRDGTIIEDLHYPKDPEKVGLLPGAADALRELSRAKGYRLFIVSNQSGVGRGLIRLDEFWTVHRRCAELLREEGIRIEAYSYCLHEPEASCGCRKPKRGLVLPWKGSRAIDFDASHVIGDRRGDLELADAIGATGWLVLTGSGPSTQAELRETRIDRYASVESLEAFAAAVPSAKGAERLGSPQERHPSTRGAIARV